MKIEDKTNAVPRILDELKRESKKVILYGAGYCGHEALILMRGKGIPVVAVCDDFRVGEDLDGIEITDIENSPCDADTVIFITSGFNVKMEERLKSIGRDSQYRKFDFGRYEKEKESYDYVIRHKEEINKAWNLLADDKSHKIFESLVNYRVSRNLELLDGLQDEVQYFPHEQNLDLSKGGGQHSFLDLGAFDGDSIKGFISYVDGRYDKIIGVEASKKNFEKLKNNLNEMHDVELHNIGVYREKTELSFTVSDAKNSFVSAEGNQKLAVDTVDNIVQGQRVTFIKMDIEGAEYDAILGAEKTIKENHPILAVSIYHLVEDLWRLQLKIEEFCPEIYNYYIRHYSPTVIETILYAVPKEG